MVSTAPGGGSRAFSFCVSNGWRIPQCPPLQAIPAGCQGLLARCSDELPMLPVSPSNLATAPLPADAPNFRRLQGVAVFPDANVVAMVGKTFRWTEAGSITTEAVTETLVRLGTGEERIFQALPLVLVMLYAAFVAWSWHNIYGNRGRRRKRQNKVLYPRKPVTCCDDLPMQQQYAVFHGNVWIAQPQDIAMTAVDTASLFGMILALYFQYSAMSASARVDLNKNYAVYQNLQTADVRIFMPDKAPPSNAYANSSSLGEPGLEMAPQARLPDELGPGSDQWMLQDNNTDLDRIGSNHLNMALAITNTAASIVISSYSILLMMLVSLLRLALINTRLGITIQAFITSFSVGQTAAASHEGVS